MSTPVTLNPPNDARLYNLRTGEKIQISLGSWNVFATGHHSFIRVSVVDSDGNQVYEPGI